MSTIAPVEDTPEDAPAKKLVKVSVTIDEAEFDRDIDTAFRNHRQRGEAAGLPARERCRARCSKPASASPRRASRRCATPFRSTWPTPCATTTSTSSPRPASSSPAGRSPARCRSTPRARCGRRSPCPATAACESSCRRPTPPRPRSTRRSRPSCAGRARSSTSIVRCSQATTSRSAWPAAATASPLPG